MSIESVAKQEVEKNRLHNLKAFETKNECPWCEGYGELNLSTCPNCDGSGEWEESETPEELHKKYKHLGLM